MRQKHSMNDYSLMNTPLEFFIFIFCFIFKQVFSAVKPSQHPTIPSNASHRRKKKRGDTCLFYRCQQRRLRSAPSSRYLTQLDSTSSSRIGKTVQGRSAKVLSVPEQWQSVKLLLLLFSRSVKQGQITSVVCDCVNYRGTSYQILCTKLFCQRTCKGRSTGL